MIFGKKQKKTDAPKQKEANTKETTTKVSVQAPVHNKSIASADVLRQPRVTEKAAYMTDDNVYAFEVDVRATKIQIAQAIKDMYGVEPMKIRVLPIPQKNVTNRKGVRGSKRGGKKAYVFLKDGDSIQVV